MWGLNQCRVEFSTSMAMHINGKFTNLNCRGRLESTYQTSASLSTRTNTCDRYTNKKIFPYACFQQQKVVEYFSDDFYCHVSQSDFTVPQVNLMLM